MKRLLATVILSLFALPVLAQVNANDHVTINTTDRLVIFHSPVISATFTYKQLQDASAITEGTASVVPHNQFQLLPNINSVYLGGPVDGIFKIPELAAIINNASQMVDTREVERFQRMQQVYNDQKFLLQNIEEQQKIIMNLQDQLRSHLEGSQEKFSRVRAWLDQSLGYVDGEQPDTGTPVEGQWRVSGTELQGYKNGAWETISDASVILR